MDLADKKEDCGACQCGGVSERGPSHGLSGKKLLALFICALCMPAAIAGFSSPEILLQTYAEDCEVSSAFPLAKYVASTLDLESDAGRYFQWIAEAEHLERKFVAGSKGTFGIQRQSQRGQGYVRPTALAKYSKIELSGNSATIKYPERGTRRTFLAKREGEFWLFDPIAMLAAEEDPGVALLRAELRKTGFEDGLALQASTKGLAFMRAHALQKRQRDMMIAQYRLVQKAHRESLKISKIAPTSPMAAIHGLKQAMLRGDPYAARWSVDQPDEASKDVAESFAQMAILNSTMKRHVIPVFAKFGSVGGSKFFNGFTGAFNEIVSTYGNVDVKLERDHAALVNKQKRKEFVCGTRTGPLGCRWRKAGSCRWRRVG
jgi:hypothetical protein